MKKFWWILICIFLVIELSSGESARKKKKQEKKEKKTGCRLRIPDDVPENEPLYLLEKKGVYSLYSPTSKETTFKAKEEIWLFCPGRANTISGSKTVNMTKLTCLDSKKFGLNPKQPVSLRTLNCTKEVTGDLKVTDKTCANGLGSIIEVGFRMNNKVFFKTYESCYNSSTASVLYSQHLLPGKVAPFVVPEDENKQYRLSGLPKMAKPNESFKKSNQEQRFSEILGQNQQFFNSTSYLVKAHLTSDSDFLFSSAQSTTYFYINVAPQWLSVHQGNWLQVERLARVLAQRAQSDLTVYTGTYDVLTLPSERTGRRTIFLEEGDRFPVVKWFWKILVNETSESAIVLMTLNNPHAKLAEAQGFCNNICSSVGLISAGLKRLTKGFTYCCELNDFRKTVTFVPKDIVAKNLLELSNISFG